MTTDEERREAAALLREYANYDFGDSDPWQYAMKAAFGDVAPHGEAETFARLADLIEPEPRSEDDAACESWIERTDSLEQWARDMLFLIKLHERGSMMFETGSADQHPLASETFLRRIEELG